MAILESLGNDVPVAIVVVLHLSPQHESHAAEILQRATSMRVSQIGGRTLLEPGHVYVIAPGTDLITNDGHIQPVDTTQKRPPGVIDLFFRSLASVHRENAVGIVVSGTGTDGAMGLGRIKEFGGLTLVQALGDCEHSGMSEAAIGAGAADMVLSAAEIGKRLAELARLPHPLRAPLEVSLPTPTAQERASSDDQSSDGAFKDILAALRVRTQHDFRHYKRATLLRRLERRIQVNELARIQDYRDFAVNDPKELESLLADMLISVTNFFRDAPAFESLERDVIPKVMSGVAEDDEVRVWVPACASGEESYSVAILLHDFAARMARPPRIQIFASDINEAALNVARAGAYPINIETDISASRLLGYFDRDDAGRYHIRPGVRGSIMFARHNVLSDPPFSRLDLVCCRNLLIYLDRTAQAAVLKTIAYALKPDGYLFLGNTESPDAAGTLFEVVDKENRIYRVRSDARSDLRVQAPLQLLDVATPPLAGPPVRGTHDTPTPPVHGMAALHQRALAAASPPSVLINDNHEIDMVSPGAGRFVAFGEGVPTRNLLNNVAADIRLELRASLFSAKKSRKPVRTVFRRSDERDPANGPVMALSVHPVSGAQDSATHWLVIFDEPVENNAHPLESDDVEHAPYQPTIRRLEEENRDLKNHLQETLDRSAVSSQELKASNEELQAVNEEMLSAKEELETGKEELQSVNEELTTVNFELRMKVDEAGRNNDDLRNLIEASNIATVFVDPAMCVKRFTPQAGKLFSLIPSDIGRPLADVRSRLRYDEMIADATAVFKQLVPSERSVTSVDDEHFLARIQPYRASGDKIGGAVLTFIDVTALRKAEQEVQQTEGRLRDAIATSTDFAVMSIDADGRIATWNDGAVKIFGHPAGEAIGQPIDIIFTAQDRAHGVPAQERTSAAREGRAVDERWHVRRDGTSLFCSGVMTPMRVGSGLGYVKIVRDVSATKDREMQQVADLRGEQQASAELKASSDLKDQFLAVMSHELKQPLNLIQVNAELLTRLPETAELAAVQRIGTTIARAVAAQETIVNDLLDLSRVRTGKLRMLSEPTDLAQLVQRLCQAMATDVAGKGIELEVQAPAAVVCNCDAVRMEQVVWNLLGNAVKFTPQGGRVSVNLSVDGPSGRLEVRDTGVGIAPEFLPHVFELFSQGAVADATGTKRAGLGIGLTLVLELVRVQGGRIEATSPGVGQGAAFTLWLPLTTHAHVSSTSAPPPNSLRRRILVVDDHADSLNAFASLLRLEGATVDTALSGAEALKMLGEKDYELLLSDIGMPGMSGLELMKLASALRPEKQFRSIAITGYGRESDVADALGAGFDAHVSKPVSIERLKTTLERLRTPLQEG